MNKFILLTIILVSFQMGFSQDSTSVTKNIPSSFSMVDVKPEFPGGMDAFYQFIAKNYRMPDVKGLSGKVITTFVIEKDGSIEEVKIIRDLGYGTGNEAIRTLKNSPKWIPAEQNGQKVRCFFALPISLISN